MPDQFGATLLPSAAWRMPEAIPDRPSCALSLIYESPPVTWRVLVAQASLPVVLNCPRLFGAGLPRERDVVPNGDSRPTAPLPSTAGLLPSRNPCSGGL